MTTQKLFGRTLTGRGASLASLGGIIAERNSVAVDVAELERRLTDVVFAYLPRWQAARGVTP